MTKGPLGGQVGMARCLGEKMICLSWPKDSRLPQIRKPQLCINGRPGPLTSSHPQE